MRINDAVVSNQHAEFVWQEAGWILRDLDSTNGTWINGRAISQARQEYRLSTQDVIAFGDESNRWVLEDDSRPQVMVVPAGGGKSIPMRRGTIRLPKNADGNSPCVVSNASGDWVLEIGESVMTIAAGSVFTASGREWRLCCPAVWQPTAKAQRSRTLRESTILLRVPRNMEKIELVVTHENDELRLGRSNIFLILVILSERKKAEREAGAKEPGWMRMDALVDAFRAKEAHINVWVHRIRGRFAGNGFIDSGAIIERRDGARQLRIGPDNVVVEHVDE